MDISSIIVGLVSALSGGGLGSLLTFRMTQRKGEFELFQAQLQQMGKELEFERQRNHELTESRNKMRDEYEAMIADKTARLRKYQDENGQLHRELIILTKQYGELEVNYAKYRCEDILCPWSQPPKQTSLPIPEDITKDDWHRQKRAKETRTNGTD